MTISSLVMLLIGLLLGLAIGWLLAELRARSSVASERARADVARAQCQAAEQRAEITAADRDGLADRFKSLSADALNLQQLRADRAAERTVTDTQRLLTPVSQALDKLEHRLAEVERERASMTASLGKQVDLVNAAGEGLRRETASLVTALRKPQVRGAWGEVQLRRVVELAGMVEHCDFEVQATTRATGQPLRPDMTIRMAGDRCVHVDAKTPLSAFLDAAGTDDPEQRATHLAHFARNVRGHIDDLSSKAYWRTATDSPEFVILFLPSDAFLQAALDEMPDLHEYASRRNIVLADPAVLIPMLKVIALAWRQQDVARSAAEVAALGRDLHDRLATLSNHLDRLGRSLTGAVKSYNSAVGSLETRVLVSARRFEEMGVTTSEVASPAPVQDATRPLTAPELTDPLASVEEADTVTRGSDSVTRESGTTDTDAEMLPPAIAATGPESETSHRGQEKAS